MCDVREPLLYRGPRTTRFRIPACCPSLPGSFFNNYALQAEAQGLPATYPLKTAACRLAKDRLTECEEIHVCGARSMPCALGYIE